MKPIEDIYGISDAMRVADAAIENLDGGLVPTPYQRSLIVLAAEVRRLREENERLRGIERAAQWYVDNPNSQRIAISQIKAAIDAARGMKHVQPR